MPYSEATIQALLNALPDAVAVVNPQGRLSMVNTAWDQLSRAPLTPNLYGAQGTEYIQTCQQATRQVALRIERNLQAAFAGAPVPLSLEYRCAGPQEEQWFRISVTSLPDATVGALLIQEDITERKQGERERIAPEKQTDEVSDLKTILLANLNHEIRNPLTGIIGYAEDLIDAVPEEHRAQARLIYQSGRRLLDLIETVVEASQLQSGEIHTQPTTFALHDAVRQGVAAFEEEARENGLYLKQEGLDEAVYVHSDREALARVLHHLIGNAIKFTRQGGVTLSGGVQGSDVSLRIIDTGVGIDPAFQGSLFKPFEQEPGGGHQALGGSGLGLSVVRGLLDALGGSIAVESEKGQGSTFTITLPGVLRPAPEPSVPEKAPGRGTGTETADAPPEKVPVHGQAATGMRRLLILEDTYITRRLMERALSDGFEVVSAEHSEEALALLRAERFDAVFLDIDLGEQQTGIEVLYELRDLSEYEDVPIIACTAHTMPGDKARFLSIGFQAYVAKPFTKKRLHEALEEAYKADITSERGAEALDISLPAPPPALIEALRLLDASTKAPDLEGLTRLLDRDPIAATWVLRHVNSGFFNLPRRVVRLDHAVRLLGFKPVCNLILGGILSHAFTPLDDPAVKKVHEYTLALSVTTATIARHLAEAIHLAKEEQETIFTGGMLHQLGRLILLSKHGTAYTRLWRTLESTNRGATITEPTRGQEFLAFETDYVRVGTQAARAWKIGDPIYTMIRAQRQPRAIHDTWLQKLVLLQSLSQVAAQTLINSAVTFPSCFQQEPARSRLHQLADLAHMPAEELHDVFKQAIGLAKTFSR